jgi:hypothetical protein
LLQRNRVSHAGPGLSAFTVTYLLGWTLLTLWALR